MDLDTLDEETTPLEVPFGAHSLHVQYRQHAILTRDILAEAQTPAETLAMASRAIASWDMTRGGAPVATTPAGLQDVPIDVLMTVMQHITEDLNPGMNGSRSSAT